MRNYKKYRSVVLFSFHSFLAGEKTKTELIDKLIAIERELKDGAYTQKGLWFRFFNNDTGATTIRNIEHWLDCPTNRESIREDFRIAINNPKGLQIHFS